MEQELKQREGHVNSVSLGIMGNMRSLANKMDKFSFFSVRVDGDAKMNGKKKTGGIEVFIEERWCSSIHVTMKEQLLSPDIEQTNP